MGIFSKPPEQEVVCGKMKIILAVIFFLCCLSLSEAHKVKNHNRKKMKVLKTDLDGLDVKIAKLADDTARLLECLNTPRSDPNWSNVCALTEETRSLDRTDVATADDVVYAASMYMNSGSRCGATQFSNCAVTLDDYVAAGTATTVSPNLSTTSSSCTFTAQAKGYYNICAHARCKKGGNACDFTVSVAGAIVAGFGDAVDYDWRSTGTCFIQELAANQAVTANLRSGGSSDCIEETSYRYGIMSMYIVLPLA